PRLAGGGRRTSDGYDTTRENNPRGANELRKNPGAGGNRIATGRITTGRIITDRVSLGLARRRNPDGRDRRGVAQRHRARGRDGGEERQKVLSGFLPAQ